jgi:hypothetical protein
MSVILRQTGRPVARMKREAISSYILSPSGFFVPKQKNERTVILKADDQTIIFNLGRDGKLQARTSSWEDPKVFRDGDRLESALQRDCGSARARGRLQNCSGAVFGTTETTLQRL